MTDGLTTTERNALKWVLFRDFYRDRIGWVDWRCVIRYWVGSTLEYLRRRKNE